MGKHQSLNLFVTLALLGCLAGIGANAQVHAIKSPPPPNQNPWIPTGTSQPWMPPHPNTQLVSTNPIYIMYRESHPTSAPKPGHQNQPYTYTQRIPTPTLQNVRVPCGPSDCVADYCTAIGCCHDGNQCYYGKAVTVQCTKDGQFIVVASKDATIPHLDTESITLLEQGSHCGPMDSNSLFAIYQFPVTACGTMVMEEDSAIIYENKLTASVEVLYGNYGAITRDSHYDLVFQCKYLGYSVQAVVQEIIQFDHLMEPAVALGPVNIQMWLGNGQCTTKGCDEMSVAFDSYYTEMDYPVTKSLREPVFVEVQILDRADPMLVLTLDRCWTTTSQSPHSMPQWDLLVNGCPYSDDHYMATLLPVPSYLDYPTHHRRFSFRMFTFVDQMSAEPQQQHVYIHCSTSLCTPHMGSGCEPTCYKKAAPQQTASSQSTKQPRPNPCPHGTVYCGLGRI
uniref:Zona pellucida sperm-binding protein 4 n=1 Tax=Gouania willdenowi TaxID=441366 RepID=A0A8C5EMG4_GOUWI